MEPAKQVAHQIIFYYIDQDQALPVIKQQFKIHNPDISESSYASDLEIIASYQSRILKSGERRNNMIHGWKANLGGNRSYGEVFRSLRWTLLSLCSVPYIKNSFDSWSADPKENGPFLSKGLDAIDTLRATIFEFERDSKEHFKISKWCPSFHQYLDRIQDTLFQRDFIVKQKVLAIEDLGKFFKGKEPFMALASRIIEDEESMNEEEIEAPVKIEALSDKYLLLYEIGLYKVESEYFGGSDPKGIAEIMGVLLDLEPRQMAQVAKIHSQFRTGSSNDPIRSARAKKEARQIFQALGITPIRLDQDL